MLFYALIIVLVFYYYTDRYKIGGTPKVPRDQEYQGKSRVTFHFYSSPTGVDWESPLANFKSVIKNLLHPYNRLISHVAVEIQSPISIEGEQRSYYEFTSMTDRGKDEFKNLFKDQIGLGVMVVNYRGKLEDAAMLQRETRKKNEQGRVHSVTYFIKDKTALKLQKYLKEYKERGVDKVYGGLRSNPRHEEGAGCVPFSTSFAEVAGLDKDEFQGNWTRTVRIPKGLIGKRKKKKKVPLTRIIFGPLGKRWATEEEPHVKIHFWDVDAIFYALKNYGDYLLDRSKEKPNFFSHYDDSKVSIKERGKSYEFFIDRTDLETPNDPIWLKR